MLAYQINSPAGLFLPSPRSSSGEARLPAGKSSKLDRTIETGNHDASAATLVLNVRVRSARCVSRHRIMHSQAETPLRMCAHRILRVRSSNEVGALYHGRRRGVGGDFCRPWTNCLPDEFGQHLSLSERRFPNRDHNSCVDLPRQQPEGTSIIPHF